MVQNYKTRLHWTAQIFISGTKKVNYFKEVSDCLEIDFPYLDISHEYILHAHIKML